MSILLYEIMYLRNNGHGNDLYNKFNSVIYQIAYVLKMKSNNFQTQIDLTKILIEEIRVYIRCKIGVLGFL